jgi:hypothetical protein
VIYFQQHVVVWPGRFSGARSYRTQFKHTGELRVAPNESFLDRLTWMNWVEVRIKTEQAIDAEIGPLWQELATAIKEAVGTYNQQYGTEHGAIQVEPNGKYLWLKRETYKKVDKNISRQENMELKVLANPKAASVTAECNGYPAVSLTVNVRMDGNQELFLCHDSKEISLDAASKMLIEGFLFNNGFSIKPH